MFDLKRPCVSCPFRKGLGSLFRLPSERLDEIVSASAFQCHKTLDYGHSDDDHGRQGDNPQQCAGLMSILSREGRPNQIMQVATRLGVLDPLDIDPRQEAYSSLDALRQAHSGTEP